MPGPAGDPRSHGNCLCRGPLGPWLLGKWDSADLGRGCCGLWPEMALPCSASKARGSGAEKAQHHLGFLSHPSGSPRWAELQSNPAPLVPCLKPCPEPRPCRAARGQTHTWALQQESFCTASPSDQNLKHSWASGCPGCDSPSFRAAPGAQLQTPFPANPVP